MGWDGKEWDGMECALLRLDATRCGLMRREVIPCRTLILPSPPPHPTPPHPTPPLAPLHHHQTTVATKLLTTKEQIHNFEDAFQKIRLATGLIEESDIIRRYINRTDQMKSADDENKRMTVEIERLTKLCAKTKAEIEELKYSGAGLSEGFNREEVDRKTEALEAMRKMLRNKRRDCALARNVVVEIEQCVSGILERLEALRVESSPKVHHHHSPRQRQQQEPGEDSKDDEDGDEEEVDAAGSVSAPNSIMVFSHRPGSPNHEPHVDGGNDPS